MLRSYSETVNFNGISHAAVKDEQRRGTIAKSTSSLHHAGMHNGRPISQPELRSPEVLTVPFLWMIALR